VFQKSDAKIQITISTAYLVRIKYPFSGLNYRLSDVNVANFNKIHRTVSEHVSARPRYRTVPYGFMRCLNEPLVYIDYCSFITAYEKLSYFQ